MGKFEPGDTKAWRIRLDGEGAMWVDEAAGVVLECTDDDGETPLLIEERVAAMQPGDEMDAGCEDHCWTISCHMVDKAWLDNLPEGTGW